jgi:hypothetical protein
MIFLIRRQNPAKMRASLFFINLYLLIALQICKAQSVAINPTGGIGKPSAGLDIDFANKGLLIPRINLTNINDTITIPSPANALMVYNTNANLINGIGFYFYCSGGCAVKGWKFINFSDNSPSPTVEWTYYSKHTFVNSSNQLDFSSLPTHDKWKLVLDVQNSIPSSSLSVGLRLNGKSTFIYGTKPYPTGHETSWIIYNGSPVASAFSGEVIITGKYFSNQNSKTFIASIGGNELYAGQEASSGFMINDPNNVYLISVLTLQGLITGSIELWFKDNR